MDKFKRAIGQVAVAFVAIAIVGCGGGGGGSSPAPPTVDVSGTWSGSWRSSNGVNGGQITFLSLSQSGSMVTGQLSFTASPCFSGGALSGVVSANEITGSLTAGSIRVDVDATVTGNQMNGTYHAVSGCLGDTGTFSATR